MGKQQGPTEQHWALTMLKPLTVWITTYWGKFFKMGLPEHLTYLLRNLYAGQEATVRNGHGTTNWLKIGKGVCQDYSKFKNK